MISKSSLLAGICGLYSLVSFGCDGCSSQFSSSGILTQLKSNIITLKWDSYAYQINTDYSEATLDRFHTTNLLFRYAITPKFKFTGTVPYLRKERVISEDNWLRSGLSDITIGGAYSLVDKTLRNKLRSYLEFEAAMVLPAGKYNERIHDDNLPNNFNVGKGSWGNAFTVRGILNSSVIGIVGYINYLKQYPSISGYSFGDQFSSQIGLFKELKLKSIQMIPAFGISFERSFEDQYSNGNTVHATGMEATYFSLSNNFKTNSWILGATYDHFIDQVFPDGDIENNRKYSIQLSFIF